MEHTVVLENAAAERAVLFTRLYRQAFPVVAKYVSKTGGSFEDAKDVFQDALVIYYEKQAAGAVDIRLSERAYILGIAKHLWYRKSKTGLPQTGLGDMDETIAAEEMPPSSSATRLMELLHTSGQKCMELLRAFYYDRLPLHKIASAFGFSGVRSATVQKYKCLEKVRNTIKEKSLSYEDFLE
jgi:DNA-directed RNA polymerase specialized sigma24 family protein